MNYSAMFPSLFFRDHSPPLPVELVVAAESKRGETLAAALLLSKPRTQLTIPTCAYFVLYDDALDDDGAG